MGRQHLAEEQWAKISIDTKRSSYIEDCFEKSQNYCNTGDRTAELNIQLEDPVSTKTVRRELHKSNIHGTAGIVGSNLTKSMDVWCVYAFILCLCYPVFR
jgi:hypothetical protein